MVFPSSIAVLMVVDDSLHFVGVDCSLHLVFCSEIFDSLLQRFNVVAVSNWCFSSRDFFTINICSRKKDFNASILEFDCMIWSLKSHTEMLLSIELEVSSCSRAIGSWSVERWISDGVSVKMLCCGVICSTSMWFQH